MNFYAISQFFQEHDGQLTTQMLLKFFQSFDQIVAPKLRGIEIESKRLHQANNSIQLCLGNTPLQKRVSRIQGYADSDGFSMADAEVTQLFQLMRSPVPKIKRS